MHQDDDIELARTFQLQGIEFLEQYHLPATPINYSVAYLYVSRRNNSLNSEMASCTAQGETPNNALMEAMFNRHLTGNDEFETELVAPFDKVMAEMLSKMNDQADADKQFANELADADYKIKTSEDGQSIQQVVSNLAIMTDKARATHDMLANELTQATDEINQLKSKLEETKKQAITDMLTGLMNRRGFEQQLEELDHNAGCACLLLDIDHFKNFNDTFGHFIGDHVLKRVAKEIKDNVRGRDLPVRFGGEEFLVLLVDTPLTGAKKVAETIRKKIADLRLVQRKSKQPLPPINISIGIAMHQQNEEWNTLFKRADSALYHAKEQGRNQSALCQQHDNRECFEVISKTA